MVTEEQYDTLMTQLQKSDMKINFLLGIFTRENPFDMSREEVNEKISEYNEDTENIKEEMKIEDEKQAKIIANTILSSDIIGRIIADDGVIEQSDIDFVSDNEYAFKFAVFSMFESEHITEEIAPELNEVINDFWQKHFKEDFEHLDESELCVFEEFEDVPDGEISDEEL